MEAAAPKQAAALWVEGFRQACCLHRVVILCRKSRNLTIRTGQCFLLNGFIFLGSLIILNSFIVPSLNRILPVPDPENFTEIWILYYSSLRWGLVQLFYLAWFYPLYLLSFVLSNLWYNDIAKYGYSAMGKHNRVDEATETSTADLGRVMVGIGEQVYSMLLLTCFLLQVYATGFIPYVGKVVNFVLLSWMYAYYCFEYKWNFSGVSLDKRLELFESNWAFFAGFGSPCVLPLFFFSTLVSYGCMAILFPLFVLTATGTEAEQVIMATKIKWGGDTVSFGRLRIFKAADGMSMKLLSLFSLQQSKGQLLEEKKDT